VNRQPTIYEVILGHSVNPAVCDRAAVIDCDSGIELSWRDLVRESMKMSSAIVKRKQGVAPSVLVGVTRDPTISFILMVAAWNVGAMYLPVNPSLRKPEIQSVLSRLSGENLVVVAGESEVGQWLFSGCLIPLSEIQNQGPDTHETSHVSFGPSDKFMFGLMTSGSTGQPKLIKLSAHNLFHAAQIELRNDPKLNGKCVFNIRPHFTSGGCNSIWPTVYSAGTILQSREASQISRFSRLRSIFKKYHIDLFIVSPSMLHALLESDDGEALVPGSDSMPTYFGGMAIPARAVSVLTERGLNLRMRYGMTEIAHIVSISAPNSGSVGRAYSGIEVKERDGFLWFRGPGISDSCSREDGGWFKSDDLGSISDEGEILLRGREQAIVNVNGFRFPLDEPAKLLASHPSVSQVVVLARNDDRFGAELVAFYQTSESSEETELGMRKLAEENLSSFKRPVEYFKVLNWPHTSSGKTDTQALWSMVKKRD